MITDDDIKKLNPAKLKYYTKLCSNSKRARAHIDMLKSIPVSPPILENYNRTNREIEIINKLLSQRKVTLNPKTDKLFRKGESVEDHLYRISGDFELSDSAIDLAKNLFTSINDLKQLAKNGCYFAMLEDLSDILKKHYTLREFDQKDFTDLDRYNMTVAHI